LLTSVHADPVAVVGKTNCVPSGHDTIFVVLFTETMVQTLSTASTPPMMVGVLLGQYSVGCPAEFNLTVQVFPAPESELPQAPRLSRPANTSVRTQYPRFI
jgi:hypothetical protein